MLLPGTKIELKDVPEQIKIFYIQQKIIGISKQQLQRGLVYHIARQTSPCSFHRDSWKYLKRSNIWKLYT